MSIQGSYKNLVYKIFTGWLIKFTPTKITGYMAVGNASVTD